MAPRIYTGPEPLTNIPRTSVFSFLLPINDPHAHQPAFIDAPTGDTLTRGEVQHLARVIAYGLRLQLQSLGALNVGRHGTILVFSGNSLAVPLGILGALAGGIKVSMASSSLTPPELAYQIKDSEPSHLFVAPELVGTAIAALESIGVKQSDIRRRVLLLAFKKNVPADVAERGLLDLNDIMHVEREYFPEEFDNDKADTTAMLFYSSGTTGLPKGVELTHYNLVAVCAQIAASPYKVHPSTEDPQNFLIFGIMPHYHVYGGVMLLFFPLLSLSPSIIPPKFEPKAYLETIQRYRPTYLYIAPPIAAFLAESPLVDQYDLSSIKSITCSAAALSPTINAIVRKRLQQRGATNLHIGQGFGSTEMSPGILMTPYLKDHKPAASGILLPNIEARIIDESGNDVPEGQPGELIVRGPNAMKGYLRKPEATRNTVKDGWLYTGDIVRRDHEGYFFVVDRIKELIKYKGFQISPVEMEDLLLKHPQVLDVAVVGVRDPKTSNELPRAYIVPRDSALIKPGAKFTPDIYKYVKEHASHYKQLRGGVVTIKAIPKSPAGKVLRRELRALAEAESQELSQPIRAKL